MRSEVATMERERDANAQVDILWAGQIALGYFIDQYRSEMHPDTLARIEEFMSVVNDIRIAKAHRISQRRRQRAARRMHATEAKT
jgi:hypothetical protein